MAESEPLKILLAHDRWANTLMFDACKALSSDQFHQKFAIGLGSLHDTLAHVIAAKRALAETLAGAASTPRIDEDKQARTPAELSALFDEASAAFDAEAYRRPFDETVVRKMRSGKTLTLTRGAVLMHIMTHGVHHRAQCLNMLRQLGVTPLPASSVAEWTYLGDTAS